MILCHWHQLTLNLNGKLAQLAACNTHMKGQYCITDQRKKANTEFTAAAYADTVQFTQVSMVPLTSWVYWLSLMQGFPYHSPDKLVLQSQRSHSSFQIMCWFVYFTALGNLDSVVHKHPKTVSVSQNKPCSNLPSTHILPTVWRVVKQ